MTDNNSKPQSNKRFDNLVSYLLERYLQSQNSDRVRVIKAISIYEDPRVIPFALSIVKDGHPNDVIATEALKLLAKRRVTDVVPIIADIIKTTHISSTWLLCLGRIGNIEAEAIINDYLRHRDTMLRGSAMFALALIARERDSALETLSALADDPISTIRHDAINALAGVGVRAIYTLVCLLHSDYQTTQQAIKVLGEIKAKQAVPHLIPFLLKQSTSEDRALAEIAAHALQFIGTPGALDALHTWKQAQHTRR